MNINLVRNDQLGAVINFGAVEVTICGTAIKKCLTAKKMKLYNLGYKLVIFQPNGEWRQTRLAKILKRILNIQFVRKKYIVHLLKISPKLFYCSTRC